MQLSQILSVSALALPMATAFQLNALPAMIQAAFDDNEYCNLPKSFEIEQFQIWTPSAGNTNSQLINFAYWDNSTDLQTICHLNGTSENVAGADLAPRYACENSNVEFIWQNGTLTMIEKPCPDTMKGWEAAGATTFDLTCVKTSYNSTDGAGTDCFSFETFVDANFTSLEPTPES